MPTLVSKKWFVSAAHFLYDVKGLDAEVHGHTFEVEVTVASEGLVRGGVVLEPRDLDRAFRLIWGEFLSSLINRISPFDEVSPSLENLARYTYEGFVETFKKLPGLKVVSASVGDGICKAIYLVDK